jgi:hypothetical protein
VPSGGVTRAEGRSGWREGDVRGWIFVVTGGVAFLSLAVPARLLIVPLVDGLLDPTGLPFDELAWPTAIATGLAVWGASAYLVLALLHRAWLGDSLRVSLPSAAVLVGGLALAFVIVRASAAVALAEPGAFFDWDHTGTTLVYGVGVMGLTVWTTVALAAARAAVVPAALCAVLSAVFAAGVPRVFATAELVPLRVLVSLAVVAMLVASLVAVVRRHAGPARTGAG